ncbi:hypothetical protein ALC57_06009, partial [Trachymyrmex cornetzi]
QRFLSRKKNNFVQTLNYSKLQQTEHADYTTGILAALSNKTARVILTIVVNDEESSLESAEFIRAVQRPTGRKTCLMLNAGATSQS